ncbi:MAG: hypothetical protein KBD10_02655 [Candidatus Pacebacteria bacterium]|nr:hypothetical protein [Candidatus Paceibacterota bacterium]
MSESNHVFTIDNRVISYSVYEQALKDIEALKVENKLLKNQLCFTNSSWPHEKHLHEKIEQLKSDNEKLQSQVDVMREALSKVIKAAEFYSSHADCKNDSWSCKCSYCRPNDHSINVSHAKKYLKKLEGE